MGLAQSGCCASVLQACLLSWAEHSGVGVSICCVCVSVLCTFLSLAGMSLVVGVSLLVGMSLSCGGVSVLRVYLCLAGVSLLAGMSQCCGRVSLLWGVLVLWVCVCLVGMSLPVDVSLLWLGFRE